MTNLLQNLQDAIDGEQPPDNWKALLRVARSTIQYHEEESRVYQQLLEQASDKLSALSQPLFRIGDTVTSWSITGSNQNEAVYGVGDGRYSTGKILKVHFQWGCYLYDMDTHDCNVYEPLIRKVG